MLNKKVFPFATLIVICLAAIGCEESAGMQLVGGAVSPSEGDSGQTEAISPTAKGSPTSHRTITQAFLDTMRTPVGFSMGFFELYASNLLAQPSDSRSSMYTMTRPRMFVATKGKRSQFQLDYSFGYRQYNRHREVHSDEHSAILRYDYQLSPNTALHITDDFRSARNDRSTLPTGSAPVLYQPHFAQGLYLPGERFTINSLVTGLSYHAGKRSNVTLFTSYDLWRYDRNSFGDAHGIQLGIRGDLQINKWFFLESSYSHYLSKVPGRFPTTNIHRLQIGGFKFKLRRSVEVYVSSGADSTRFQDRQRNVLNYEGGISKQSGSTLISLVYHRGLSLEVGPQTTLNGHTVSVSLSQWLSRRVNIQTTSVYTRGSSLNKASRLDYLGANAQLDVVLQRHLLYSVQYSYISQRASLPSDNLRLALYTVTTGFQLVLPSIGGRERGVRQLN